MPKLVWRSMEVVPGWEGERYQPLLFLVEHEGKLHMDFFEAKPDSFTTLGDEELLQEFEKDLQKVRVIGKTFWYFAGKPEWLSLLPESYRKRLEEQIALESL